MAFNRTDAEKSLYDAIVALSISGGGAATIADGADVAEGAVADAAWSGSGSGTVIALLKAMATQALSTADVQVADSDQAAAMTAQATLLGGVTETAPATDTASAGHNGRLQRIAQRLTTLIGVHPASIGSKTAAASLAVALATDEPLIGALTETAPASDTASSGLNGRLQRIAQRLTSLIALVPAALGAGGGLKVDGSVAHGSADAGQPVKVGGRAISAEITALANNNRSDFVTDLAGKQIVLPYANPENFVSGAITSAMAGTTSTSLVAAPAAGLRNYITTIIVSNAHATVGTDVIIQDGSGGTTLMTIPAAAVYGGAVITLPTPLRQPTTATALFCANVTTGASTKVSALGYKGI